MVHQPAHSPQNDLQNSKKALRRHFLQQREQVVSPENHTRIMQHLTSWPVFLQSQTILLYRAFRNEVDLTGCMAQYPQKQWYFPVSKEDASMQFYQYRQGESWIKGQYGIEEPVTEEKQPLQAVDSSLLVLVPGLAFSPDGYRLGYGKGVYDRWIQQAVQANCQTVTLVGVLESRFLASTLPADVWDRKMDYLLTETGLSPCFSLENPLNNTTQAKTER
jgi:5-formyltetrahydrofolate cyclo-ligase